LAYLAAPPAIGTDVEISDQARAIIRINIPPIIHERIEAGPAALAV